ncbi:MAG TPA: hypothetical protein VH062_07905 [Polyangiaceae bacterium]|nr:hypothetical protein [Polyangiaceae bacterium]
MAIQTWWLEHRPAAPALFVDELEALEVDLAKGILRGVTYAFDEATRRALLPRCRYHVYDEVNKADRIVQVLAVWQASRGQGPTL